MVTVPPSLWTVAAPAGGWVRISPRMWSMAWVPAMCEACPTVMKIEDLVIECTSMCSSAAKVPNGPPMPNPKVARPMCSMEE